MQRRKRRLVLTNQAKITLFLLGLLSVYMMISAFTPQPMPVGDPATCEHFVCVHTGDTLWEIASENNPEQKNVRKWVDEIMAFNNMTSPDIHPGDKILLPL